MVEGSGTGDHITASSRFSVVLWARPTIFPVAPSMAKASDVE